MKPFCLLASYFIFRRYVMNSSREKTFRFIIAGEIGLLVLLILFLFLPSPSLLFLPVSQSGKASSSEAEDYIKWVDFDVTARATEDAFRYDLNTCQSEPHLNWVNLLACLGAEYGGDFSRYSSEDMDRRAGRLLSGETMEQITANMKYYPYYREAYGAVLDGLVGTYEIEIPADGAPLYAVPSVNEDGAVSPDKVWVSKYGLKGFSPIAKGFPYTDYDDFGASRSYGYNRKHLGHDMMGQVGTPIVAVESGYVDAIGWNQYGGWRLGIRSFDGKRYYYYAHLRKNYPYHKSLEKGSIVTAGDVIGYLGRTGYSQTENTNNIEQPHLHFGLQLIFHPSQKEGNHEIWINCYELIQFLSMNTSETIKNQETKEYNRVYKMADPAIPENFAPPADNKEQTNDS